MNEVKKFCADCKTTKTPLWRSGPHGPRSLCNACGIRFRKRKMAEDDQQQQQQQQQPSSETRKENDDQINKDQFLKTNFNYREMGNMIFAQRSSSSSSSSSSLQSKKQRNSSEDSINSSSNRNLGEVEQAAVLLLSLSCGSVFA